MNKMAKKNTSAGYAEVQDYDHVVKMLKNSSEFYAAQHNLLKKYIKRMFFQFAKFKVLNKVQDKDKDIERRIFFHVI